MSQSVPLRKSDQVTIAPPAPSDAIVGPDWLFAAVAAPGALSTQPTHGRTRAVVSVEPREATAVGPVRADHSLGLAVPLELVRGLRAVGAEPVPAASSATDPGAPAGPLTEEELEQVCGLPDPYGFVSRLLVGTGLRWGEAVRFSRWTPVAA